MSLAQKAARGALWTVISSMGGRAVGVLGTLIMTRFLAPEEIGEVGVALVVVMSANWITIWGFGQYAVVKGRGPDAAEVTWHATFFYLSLGTISLGLMAAFGDRLMPYFNASDAVDYIPWLALAFFAVHQCLFGVYLGSIFAPNHKGMEMPATRMDFLRKQVLTSRNVGGGRYTDGLVHVAMGGLNHQIEHHLFPSMPTPNLRKARPLVRQFCAELGVSYHETGLVRSWAESLGQLRMASAALR